MYTLNGKTYTFGTIPPYEAVRIQVAIARVTGEAIFKSFAGYKKGDNVDLQAIGSVAIGLMASRMDPDELVATMEAVFNYVNVDKRKLIVDSDFNGKPKDMWLVFFQALRHNFSDFIIGLPLDFESLGKTE
jgi:hypothetical protein